MYSKKQREKAIKLYIQFRFKASKVISVLGYPDRRVLKKWYDDYIKSNNKVIIKPYKNRQYSKEDRSKAVNYCLNYGKNISVTVKELGYPCRSVLSNWIC